MYEFSTMILGFSIFHKVYITESQTIIYLVLFAIMLMSTHNNLHNITYLRLTGQYIVDTASNSILKMTTMKNN
jgi:hypothetical protein